MKEVLTNEKFLAIFAITIISCWAMASMGDAAKDVIIPAVTGICGFVSGSFRKQSPPDFPAMDTAVREGAEKLQAEQVKAVEEQK